MCFYFSNNDTIQETFACPKLKTETLGKVVKFVQSNNKDTRTTSLAMFSG